MYKKDFVPGNRISIQSLLRRTLVQLVRKSTKLENQELDHFSKIVFPTFGLAGFPG